jgi:hypothetical protein
MDLVPPLSEPPALPGLLPLDPKGKAVGAAPPLLPLLGKLMTLDPHASKVTAQDLVSSSYNHYITITALAVNQISTRLVPLQRKLHYVAHVNLDDSSLIAYA